MRGSEPVPEREEIELIAILGSEPLPEREVIELIAILGSERVPEREVTVPDGRGACA